MTRRAAILSLVACPLAAIAPPVARALLGSQSSTPGQDRFHITLTVDARDFMAAVKRLQAEFDTWEMPPTQEEVNAHLEGMPSLVLKMDGKEISQFHVFNVLKK